MEYQYARIVLTGGPCSGKTTILNHLQLPKIPEVATELLKNGYPAPTNSSEVWDFQKKIAQTQIEWERAIMKFNVKFWVQDRGLLDGAAYLDNSADIEKLVDGDIEKALYPDNLKTVVIFLHNAAAAGKDVYENLKKSNPHRMENYDDALALHNKMLAIYEKSHYDIIEVKPFETGINGVLNTIDKIKVLSARDIM